MSWKLLYHHLGQLPRARSREFEELVARLLCRLLGARFVVARSGTQASGDVRSLDGSVVVQAKNYSGESRVDLVNLEGDISRACRSLPSLDVYVVAVSKEDAQLRNTVDELQQENGIDVAVLELHENTPSPLGALCAHYWEDISATPVFQGAPHELVSFLQQEARSAVHAGTAAELRRELGTGLRTWASTRRRALELLRERFGRVDTRRRFASRIDLSRAVERARYIDAAEAWWQTAEPVLRVQGEEGTGKTWLAALAVERLAAREDTAVLWLDSSEWSSIDTVRGLLDHAMGRIEDDPTVRKRMVSKAVGRWSGTILLVLDGANERGAVRALAGVLTDLFDHAHRPGCGHLRLLVTTRALEGTPEFQSNLWNGCGGPLEVGGYDDAELAQALGKVGGHLSLDDMRYLRPVVCLPRYFSICVELWSRLQSFDVVTKELLHWEDLRAKITKTDPQVYENLGLRSTGDAAEVLAKLARSAPSVSGGLLKEVLGRQYLDIRRDLVEQRIVGQAERGAARVSPGHVVLGWALWLQRLALPAPGERLPDCIVRLQRELEPIPESDQRTEALFVALSLTAFAESHGSDGRPGSAVQRTALLACWAQSQNAALTPARLEFWGRHDCAAYAGMLEYLYNSTYSQTCELALVAPLARVWASERPDSGVARAVAGQLRRWLLLSIRPNLPEAQGHITCEGGHELPVAQSAGQLRLSAVALSVLSCRPDPSLLEAVALCTGTLNESTIVPEGTNHEYHIKAPLATNISALMRWGYGRCGIPYLARIVETAKAGDPLADGASHLAWMTGEDELPAAITRARYWVKTTRSPTLAERLRDEHTVLLPKDRCIRLLPGTGALAVRRDLGELSAEALAELAAMADAATASGVPHGPESGFRLEELRQLLPWLHRCFPRKGMDLCRSLLLPGLTEEDCGRTALELSLYPPLPGELDAALDDSVAATVDGLLRSLGERALGRHLMETEHLWSVALFCLSEDRLPQLMESCWRPGEATLMTVRILRSLAPEAVSRNARARCQHLLPTVSGHDDKTESANAFCRSCSFWIMALRPPDQDAFEFGLSALLRPGLPADCIRAIFALLGASGIQDGFRGLVLDERTRKLLDRDTIWTFFWHCPPDHVPAMDVPAELLAELASGAFPKEYLGLLTAPVPESTEFRQWGEEMMLLAIAVTRSQAPSVEHRCGTRAGLDQRGAVVTNPGHGPVSCSAVSPSVAYWGMEYPARAADGLDKAIEADKSDCYAWCRDAGKLRPWQGFMFHRFPAWRELGQWAETYPERFGPLADEYLGCLRDPTFGEFHLHTFTFSVLAALAATEPDKAYRAVRRLRSRGGFAPNSTGRLFFERFWNVGRAGTPDHYRVREDTLRDCRSDAELMTMAIFAQTAGGADALLAVCQDLLGSGEARDRNMALSLLPWLCHEQALGEIVQARDHDTNRWVREHAAWACDTAMQEEGCRTTYRRALLSNDRDALFSALHVIRPALMPTACHWHPLIEKELDHLPWRQDRRVQAVLTAFWEHWHRCSPSWGSPECNGRRLVSWFCGEELRAGIHEHMAPWWDGRASQR